MTTTDPEVVTGQLRQLEILQRQRKGKSGVSTDDLILEAQFAESLLKRKRGYQQIY